MFTLLRQLYRIGLLSPSGLWRIAAAVRNEGINLMTLSNLAARLHPQREAVDDTLQRYSYAQLQAQARQLAAQLAQRGICKHQRIALACRNHAAQLLALFAVSRLGAHIYLVNPEFSQQQLAALHDKQRFDYWIGDETLRGFVESAGLNDRFLAAESTLLELAKTPIPADFRFRRSYGSRLVVLTGGTTGTPKAASRKPSLFAFLAPFFALLQRVHLDRYRSVYIATPIYHGFGVASVFISMVLGAKMFLRPRFDASQSCDLIASQQIEVLTLVPIMLQRLLEQRAEALASVQAFVTGGAPLSPRLATTVLQRLGLRLFNLYGTSEAGFCIMATPLDLQAFPDSIGKPIAGVRLRLLDAEGKAVAPLQVGRIAIRSRWSVGGGQWMETGDLAYQDASGRLFLCGRIDDMIVSGGENVYPIELENVLLQHPQIAQAAVIGVPDAEFGQRLRAFVVWYAGQEASEEKLRAWLKPRVARFQMPASIVFLKKLPYTHLGKVNKKLLY